MMAINGLKIHPSVFTTKFPEKCVVPHCKSLCCEGGAWIDIKEKEKILKHKELFKRYLRKKIRDEAFWFEDEEEDEEAQEVYLGQRFTLNKESTAAVADERVDRFESVAWAACRTK